MTEVIFGLGSNVGDRRKFLDQAIRKLSEKVDAIVLSAVYQTEPWGNEDQPAFLNLCANGRTRLSPEELLNFVKNTEKELGRKHTEKWGPREIDIDILFYGSEVISSEFLEIPHPNVAERAFVLIPLAEIAPDFVHPILKKTISELAAGIDSKGVEKAEDE